MLDNWDFFVRKTHYWRALTKQPATFTLYLSRVGRQEEKHMVFERKSVAKRGAAHPVDWNASIPENRPALPNSALAACIGESGTDPGLEAAMLARLSSLLGTDEATPSPLKIHYNSLKPRQFSAKAYTQGMDIYLAPGEEDSLSHELGHVRQQALGGIQPTRMVAGQPVNDDPLLEAEADDTGYLTGWLPTAASGSVIQCDGDSDEEEEPHEEIPRVKYTRDHPPNGMKAYGDNQGLTFHRAVERVDGRHNIRFSTLSGIYTRGNEERGIRYPHSFRDTPYRQVARWFASALSDNSGISGEIQCYFDEESHELLISTNKAHEMEALSKIRKVTSEPLQRYSKAYMQRRRERHMRNFNEVARRLAEGEMVYGSHSGLSDEAALEQQRIYRDIYSYSVRFIPPGAFEDLHAEQRILEYLRERTHNNELLLDPTRLGGLRRPCLACAWRIFPDEDARQIAGPYWDSNSAVAQWASRDLVLEDADAGTHVTASKAGSGPEDPIYVLHYDADSDSDDEDDL